MQRKKIFQSLDACSKFFTTSIKQFPNILYCIHKNYQRYLRQKSQRTPFDLPTQQEIFSREPVSSERAPSQEAHFDSDNYPWTMYPTIGIHLGPRLPTYYFDLLVSRGNWAPPFSCRDIIPFCNSIFCELSSAFF